LCQKIVVVVVVVVVSENPFPFRAPPCAAGVGGYFRATMPEMLAGSVEFLAQEMPDDIPNEDMGVH
jgi:hypothetical protein